MTTWYVEEGSQNGNGSEAAPFGTLAAAGRVAAAGDVVVIGQGTYPETPQLPAGTIWRAAEGAHVVIDGGWKGKRMADDSGKPAVAMGDGASLVGVTIRNALGAGVVLGNDSRLMRCVIERSYANGVHLWKIKGARVEGCTISESCIRFTVGGHQGGASVAIVDCADCEVIGNTICYGYGEGVDIGRGSKKIRVAGNIIFDHKHVQLYFVRSQECVAEGNVVFHTGDERFLTRNGRAPGGIVFGDENTAKMRTFPPMRANTVRGNLVVNMGGCLSCRNNNPATHKDDSPYDTSLDADTLIEGNTFVAGPMTQDAVLIVPNLQGRPHGPARFRRNVVIGPADAPGNFRYEANAWQPAPTAALRSADDVAVALVNAAAGALRSEYPAVGHNLRLDDYRPRPGSALAAAGIGALAALVIGPPEPPEEEEPPTDPPVDPEPQPGVDWDSLLERAASIGMQVATQAEELQGVRSSIDALKERHAILALSNEQMAMELGELLLSLEEYKQAAESGEE